MKIITPGLADALTPRDWTSEQLRRRERAPRTLEVRLPRLHLPRLHLPRVHLPHLHARQRAQ